MSDCTQKFINYLVDQTPHFDAEIMRDVRPTSGTWLGKVETRQWPSYMGNRHYFDRFTSVFANPTREWTPKEYEDCTGNPCDPTADKICWGNLRQTYFKETRSIETPILCFDQIRDVSHAKEHVAQIISEILRPATDTIMSYFLKKRAAEHAGEKWTANDTMDAFTFEWQVVSENEIYFNCSVPRTDVFKLAPQMLQRRVFPLTLKGYMGAKTFEGFPNLIELITDLETVWDLDKQASTGTVNLAQYWRYNDWTAANDYWKYGFGGQIGNYTVSVDPFILRFNYKQDLGAGFAPNRYQYQVVLPYKNVSAGSAVYEGDSFDSGNGLRSVPNEDYPLAQYQLSYIHHRKAGCVYVADATPVNPEMPFSSRNLAGQWRFANKELGCENIRGNKGKFFADFELAWKPEHPEWEEVIFHKREPSCVPEVDVCDSNPDPGYPDQDYNSACDECDEGPFLTGETCEEGEGVQVTSVTISGVPIGLEDAAKACVADHAAIAVLLNLDPGAQLMGTWDTNADGNLILTNPTVHDVDVVIACCSILS